MERNQKADLQKADLRREIRRMRERITPEKKAVWDQALCREFFHNLEKEKALSAKTVIYLYLDIRNEAGTIPILRELWQRGVRTAVPKTVGKELEFYEITGEKELAPGYMGIFEPRTEVCRRAEEKEALVVVPGLAFDRAGYRLGYGGGYYDRFFSREGEHPRWGLAYGFQVRDQVPKENWDQKMDKIITPDGTIDIVTREDQG